MLFSSITGSRKETSSNGYSSDGKYICTGDYRHKSTASKAASLNDVELESGIHKKVTVDVSVMGADDNDSQKSIIRHQ